MDPIPLPAPFGGVDDLTPIIALQPPYCENLLNFNVAQEGCILRYGDKKFGVTITQTAGGSVPQRIFTYGNSRIFVLTYEVTAQKYVLNDMESGATVFDMTTILPGPLAFSGFYDLYFNKYLFMFSKAAGVTVPGMYFNGTIFGLIGYTGTGYAPLGGNVYKNRAYMIQANEPGYWYSGISAISGPCVYVDLNTIVKEDCDLAIICSFSLSDNVSAVVLQAFVMTNGEVLFYSGSYPDSPDWTQVGDGKIGQPVDFNAYVKHQNDSLVLCDTGIISMRDLFLKGAQDGKGLSINDRVSQRWAELIQSIRSVYSIPNGPISVIINGTNTSGYIRGISDSKADRVIINIPFYLSSGAATTGNTQFIFDTQRTSWFFHQSYKASTVPKLVYDINRYKNKVILVSSGATKIMTSEKEGATDFTDRDADDALDNGYYYEIISAPVSQGRAYVQKCEGMDVILKSDLYSETNYYLTRDLGVQTSTAQKVVSTGTAGSLQKPFINMGIEGSYIQYKISGTTTSGKTVGYQIYGTNFWASAGRSPR